jgi:hypothetical protein
MMGPAITPALVWEALALTGVEEGAKEAVVFDAESWETLPYNVK